MTQPLLTVVMPVFNGEKYIREAIDSVLDQTFSDFELLIINDASVDRSLEIITSYSDNRIRVLNNPENKGIPYNRNVGLREAKGDFLCWTDCDDVNLPQRFEKQIHFLQNNLQFGGCGTWISRFKGNKTYYTTKALENPEEIKASLLFQPATIPNATAMVRLSEIRTHNLWYNESLPISEDYDFVFRCSRHFDFTNISEALYKYRDSETSIMKQFESQNETRGELHETVFRLAIAELGINPSTNELLLHESHCSQKIFKLFSDFVASYQWLVKIETANNAAQIYDQNVLKKVLASQFLYIAKKASKFGFKTLKFFVSHSLKNKWVMKPEKTLKLAVRCAIKYDKFEFRQLK